MYEISEEEMNNIMKEADTIANEELAEDLAIAENGVFYFLISSFLAFLDLPFYAILMMAWERANPVQKEKLRTMWPEIEKQFHQLSENKSWILEGRKKEVARFLSPLLREVTQKVKQEV